MAGIQGSKDPLGSDLGFEEKLEKLKLTGLEEEELDLSGELDELIKDIRWLALFRVHTTKPFSHAALFGAMRTAWSPAKEVVFKVMEDNLFLVQMNCLGDWNRLMDGGPWLFRGTPLVIEEYDGFTNVKEYKLNKIPVWTRIQGVPDGLMKRKDLAEKVAVKVGKPITVVVNEGMINPTPFLRARVFIEIDKPLVRVIPITLKDTRRHLVQYEKLPIFCYVCGLVGHEMTECGDGVHDEASCGWGDWLLVKFSVGLPARGPARGDGRGGAWSRGRGRGRGINPNYNYEDLSDQDMEVEDSRKTGIKRPGEGETKITDTSIIVANRVNALEKGSASQPPASPNAKQEKKRSRKEETSKMVVDQQAKSAPSQPEGDRAQ